MMIKSDIAIVGAGMVGLGLAAAAIKINNLHVALIDQNLVFSLQDLNATKSLRFSAINESSEQFLKSVGAWERIMALGASPYQRMRVWDATGQGVIEFDSRDLGRPHLGHIIANSIIQSALYEQIAASENLTLLCPSIPEFLIENTDAINVKLQDGRSLCTKLLAGADGAYSWVRKQAGIAITQWPYQQYSLTATIHTEKRHQQTAWQRFLPNGPLAFLPLSDSSRSSIVWTTTEEQAKVLLNLPEEEFNQKLGEAFAWHLGEVQVISERSIFPLKMRHVKRYVKPRLALLGDAAHTIHPLAGQGVNLGFSDAQYLLKILSMAESGNDIGDFKLLRLYERARKAENWEMIAAVEGFKRLFSNDSVSLSLLRNYGLNLTNRLPFFKRAIMRRAMGN